MRKKVISYQLMKKLIHKMCITDRPLRSNSCNSVCKEEQQMENCTNYFAELQNKPTPNVSKSLLERDHL